MMILSMNLGKFGTACRLYDTNTRKCAASLEIGNLPSVSYFHLWRISHDPKTTLFLGC